MLLLLLLLICSSVTTFTVHDGCVVRDNMRVNLVGMAFQFSIWTSWTGNLSLSLLQKKEKESQKEEKIEKFIFPIGIKEEKMKGKMKGKWVSGSIHFLPRPILHIGHLTKGLEFGYAGYEKWFHETPRTVVLKDSLFMPNCPQDNKPIYSLTNKFPSTTLALNNGDEITFLAINSTNTKVILKLGSNAFSVKWTGNEVTIQDDISSDSYESTEPLTLKFVALSPQGFQIKWKGQTKKSVVEVPESNIIIRTEITMNNPSPLVYLSKTHDASSPPPTAPPPSASAPVSPEEGGEGGVSVALVILTALVVVVGCLWIGTLTVTILLLRHNPAGLSIFLAKKNDNKQTTDNKETVDKGEESDLKAPLRPPRPPHHHHHQQQQQNEQEEEVGEGGVDEAQIDDNYCTLSGTMYYPEQYQHDNQYHTIWGEEGENQVVYHQQEQDPQNQYHWEGEAVENQQYVEGWPGVPSSPTTTNTTYNNNTDNNYMMGGGGVVGDGNDGAEEIYIDPNPVKPILVEEMKLDRAFKGNVNYTDDTGYCKQQQQHQQQQQGHMRKTSAPPPTTPSSSSHNTIHHHPSWSSLAGQGSSFRRRGSSPSPSTSHSQGYGMKGPTTTTTTTTTAVQEDYVEEDYIELLPNA